MGKTGGIWGKVDIDQEFRCLIEAGIKFYICYSPVEEQTKYYALDV